MSRSHRRGATALAVALTLAGTACAGDADAGSASGEVNIVQPGAPGEASEQLDEAPDLAPAAHTPADVDFMQGMIAHHVQALRMTRLVADRTDRDDLPKFAERMDISQEAELELMRDWLEARDEEVPPLGVGHEHDEGAELMPGMLTEEELLELEAAEGPAFDRRFLEGMIRHHEGALVMVEQLLAEGGGQEREVARFSTHVQADQEIELGRMRTMLAELDDA